MLQGFYSAAAGMFMQQRHLNVISNNLANAQTPGFKTNRLVSETFEELLQARLENGNNGLLGTDERTRIVSEVADIWTNGGVAETGRPFDMAITGFGFFNVRGEDGQDYITREGVFDLDEEGFLVLRNKGQVLGAGGAPLQLDISDIHVDADGNITNALTGDELGQLLITVPTADAVIEAQRNGMYTATAVEAPVNPGVVQGAFERSNVNLSDELSAMIIAQRNFSSASRALTIIDQTYAKGTNIASL